MEGIHSVNTEVRVYCCRIVCSSGSLSSLGREIEVPEQTIHGGTGWESTDELPLSSNGIQARSDQPPHIAECCVEYLKGPISADNAI